MRGLRQKRRIASLGLIPAFNRLGLLCASAVALAACGSDGVEPTTVTASVRDSAGVVIVENSAPAPDSRLPWVVGAEPVLSIGTLDGDAAYQLFGVRGATVLEDGRIAIANRGSAEIKVYTAQAEHSVSMGREGEGPGEFTSLVAAAAWAGDSILGWDSRQRRVSLFSREGEHGRTFAMPDFGEWVGPQFIGVMSSSSILIHASTPMFDDRTFEGMNREDRGYALVGSDGEIAGLLGTHPGEEGYMRAAPGMVGIWGHPQGKKTLAAPWGELSLISPNDTYELRAYDREGALARIVRMPHAMRAPTQADLQAYFDELLADVSPASRASAMETLSKLPVAESFPAFDALLVDRLDHVWVRDHQIRGEAPSGWVVFDPEGRLVGRMDTPADLEVYEIGADYILGRATDDFDIEYVQMYSLTR